ncbi:hypothetical protein [Sphingomonas rubra]|uniref:Uncharacterized protein n=1 Tax=Sphingomonas rubra TaxID=634430 RepID=A0A1I5RAQ5_9SPHN|nr:hypothetical protein [Sphingomonas rubra]SFP55589.1 hypothetical protein SAMN04488241_103126 [Sphingomonas rubra]
MSSDIARLATLRTTLAEMERPGLGFANDQAIAGTRSAIRMIEQAWPDERLQAAHAAAIGQGEMAERDALLAEIEHRGLHG